MSAEFRVTLHPGIHQRMEYHLKKMRDTGLKELMVRRPPADLDPDFLEYWEDSLKKRAEEDLEALFRWVFPAKTNGQYVGIPEDQVDHVIRALSGVRLVIRETFLADWSDQQLERGEFSLHNRGPEDIEMVACFFLLAEWQEGLVQQIFQQEADGEAGH